MRELRFATHVKFSVTILYLFVAISVLRTLAIPALLRLHFVIFF